jgi:hypothetical protein
MPVTVPATTGTGGDDVNQLVLEGRLSADPDVKELDGGAVLVLLRVVVRRPDGSRVDSLPVVVGPPPARGRRREPGQARARDVRRAAGLAAGDRVRVEGFLQRRFWDAGGGRRSRLQVVAATLDRR